MHSSSIRLNSSTKSNTYRGNGHERSSSRHSIYSGSSSGSSGRYSRSDRERSRESDEIGNSRFKFHNQSRDSTAENFKSHHRGPPLYSYSSSKCHYSHPPKATRPNPAKQNELNSEMENWDAEAIVTVDNRRDYSAHYKVNRSRYKHPYPPSPSQCVSPRSRSTSPLETRRPNFPMSIQVEFLRSPTPVHARRPRSPSPIQPRRPRSPSPIQPRRPRSPLPMHARRSRSPSPMQPRRPRSPSPMIARRPRSLSQIQPRRPHSPAPTQGRRPHVHFSIQTRRLRPPSPMQTRRPRLPSQTLERFSRSPSPMQPRRPRGTSPPPPPPKRVYISQPTPSKDQYYNTELENWDAVPKVNVKIKRNYSITNYTVTQPPHPRKRPYVPRVPTPARPHLPASDTDSGIFNSELEDWDSVLAPPPHPVSRPESPISELKVNIKVEKFEEDNVSNIIKVERSDEDALSNIKVEKLDIDEVIKREVDKLVEEEITKIKLEKVDEYEVPATLPLRRQEYELEPGERTPSPPPLPPRPRSPSIDLPRKPRSENTSHNFSKQHKSKFKTSVNGFNGKKFKEKKNFHKFQRPKHEKGGLCGFDVNIDTDGPETEPLLPPPPPIPSVYSAGNAILRNPFFGNGPLGLLPHQIATLLPHQLVALAQLSSYPFTQLGLPNPLAQLSPTAIPMSAPPQQINSRDPRLRGFNPAASTAPDSISRGVNGFHSAAKATLDPRTKELQPILPRRITSEYNADDENWEPEAVVPKVEKVSPITGPIVTRVQPPPGFMEKLDEANTASALLFRKHAVVFDYGHGDVTYQ